MRYDSKNREHHLTLTMTLPIVNDGIKKLRSGRQGRKYEVIPGTDKVALVSKKKDGRGWKFMNTKITHYLNQSVTVE